VVLGLINSMGPARINHQIKVREVRVIGHDGKQLGIFDIDDALNLARSYGMDLVEIAANATPPVVRIVSYEKFLEDKKKRMERPDYTNN
jgi:translation initiation factor IF-3